MEPGSHGCSVRCMIRLPDRPADQDCSRPAAVSGIRGATPACCRSRAPELMGARNVWYVESANRASREPSGGAVAWRRYASRGIQRNPCAEQRAVPPPTHRVRELRSSAARGSGVQPGSPLPSRRIGPAERGQRSAAQTQSRTLVSPHGPPRKPALEHAQRSRFMSCSRSTP
jgi:hypothetical protein